MKFRFVYVGSDGAEVEVASVEALRARVAAGELEDETLLYDGLTREWAPARVHPVYRLIRDGMDVPTPGGEPAGPPVADASAASPSDALGLDLQLDASDLISDDPVAGEEVDHEALFWEELAKAREVEELEGPRAEPVSMASAFEDTVVGIEPAEADSADPDPVRRLRPRTAPRAADDDLPSPPAERVGRLDAPEWRPERDADGWQAGIRAEVPRRQAALMMVLAAIGGWAIADAWIEPPGRDDVPEMVHVASAYRVSPYFTRGHADVQSAAFEDMLRGMDVLRARIGVDSPPEGWLTEAYFAEPSRWSEVAVYWGKYAALVSALRAEEEDLFRSGFVSRMQRKGITGTVLTIEVARALQEFEGDRPRRELLYVAMEELAAASLALHEGLLVDAGRAGPDDPRPTTADDEDSFRRGLELERVIRAMAAVSGSEGTLDSRLEDRLGEAGLRELGRLMVEDVRG